MAKTKQEWLYQLRRCSSVNTLEKIIVKQKQFIIQQGLISNHRNIVADAFAMLSCPPRKREKVSFPPLPAFL